MNLTILGDRLLIEPIFDEEKGAIVVPEISSTKKWNRNTGILHAFGEGVHNAEPELKCGMTVVFKPYDVSTREIELRGKTFLMVKPETVIGIVENQ